ncbi:siderophore-interacting protein [Acidisoma cellulosilytica]|uniref:Siderophore-interacting protein n=1 Tax=Acidisoma cellulosilyticum TaxID=2802395 RepID=A0A963Z6I2_9PROT|nr:siderophore-interacting protein [Acidisoma cellulosilyticum]MCB8882762.1 siderophore-interacting protein [Acidisoma cellulosilyticum]
MRHEIKRRDLTISAIARVTPQMIRVTLMDDSLVDFFSGAPDDHIKIFLPQPDGEPARRDYTPRRFSQAERSLTLDFVDHDGGPAADWARAARVGDSLTIAGPRGSSAIGGDIRGWVLVGDETALPAIGRRIEELAPGMPVISIAAVTDRSEEQRFETAAELDARWVYRPHGAAADPAALLDAVKKLALPPQTFVWVAAEAGVARAIRRYLLEERGLPKAWLKASGYWVQGEADAAVKSFEDAT